MTEAYERKDKVKELIKKALKLVEKINELAKKKQGINEYENYVSTVKETGEKAVKENKQWLDEFVGKK